MFVGRDRAVRDLLTQQGLIEAEALSRLESAAETSDRSLASKLIEAGWIEKNDLLRAVAVSLGCEFVGLVPEELPPTLTSKLSPQIACDYKIVPISAGDESIEVLPVDPLNPALGEDLSFALDCPVRIHVADPERVEALLHRYYFKEPTPARPFDLALSALEAQAASPDDAAALTENDLEQLAGQTPIVQFVNLVLSQAIQDKASDIHFEPFEHTFKIRYRVDGALCDLVPPPRNLALPIISRIKVLANLNIAERRLPQDGRIKLTVAGRAVDLRVSTLPTQFGESVVLRVLDQSSVRLELRELGLPAVMRASIEEVIHRPNGIFLVTGPTGSGKTTTLYSCLKELNSSETKLLTVEDPVEYEIDGIMQVPVNPAAGLGFARALRTFLRQDPDIVMVGEIRDLETAQISIQAALTGHLVLSTLHTNDAPGTVTRLMDMGIEPFLLASTLEAVLAQRLLRRICSSCRTAYEPDSSLLTQANIDVRRMEGRPVYRGAGCAACQGSGYRGRIGLFEFVRMNDELRELITQEASLETLRTKMIAHGMGTLREAGIGALLAGDTTFEEVVKYT